MRLRPFLLLACSLLACSEDADPPASTSPPDPPVTLPAACGHAHNDYLHPRPLLDALDHGFCSVEVDVFLVGGQLLVAHELENVDPMRTLQSLYLDPLRDLHMSGTLAEGPLLLLIDVKSEAATTYAAIDAVLADYADMLTSFEGETAIVRAVTAVISGNRDRAAMEAQAVRYAAMDGRIADLGTGAPVTLIPLISQHWNYAFLWQGQGELPVEEKATLDGYVSQAHDEQRRLRFWAIPDVDNGWQTLLEAGVDLINTDDLAGFAAFASP